MVALAICHQWVEQYLFGGQPVYRLKRGDLEVSCRRGVVWSPFGGRFVLAMPLERGFRAEKLRRISERI